MKALESVLFPIGFIAFLFIPTLAVYFIGSFALWDLTWIADAAYQEARVVTAIVQAGWLLSFSLAVAGS